MCYNKGVKRSNYFYPRPPRGGRLPPTAANDGVEIISIHALRGEGDCTLFLLYNLIADFYPRPPRGGRPDAPADAEDVAYISIHALRGEGDLVLLTAQRSCGISIHALRGEGDRSLLIPRSYISSFLSTPSAGRATGLPCSPAQTLPYFYPRPPRGGRPAAMSRTSGHHTISIHALRGEGDPPG